MASAGSFSFSIVVFFRPMTRDRSQSTRGIPSLVRRCVCVRARVSSVCLCGLSANALEHVRVEVIIAFAHDNEEVMIAFMRNCVFLMDTGTGGTHTQKKNSREANMVMYLTRYNNRKKMICDENVAMTAGGENRRKTIMRHTRVSFRSSSSFVLPYFLVTLAC